MSQFRSPLALFTLRHEQQLSQFESMTQTVQTLGGSGVPVQLLCRLPSNTCEGDYVHASVTFSHQRGALLSAKHDIQERDIGSGMIAMTLYCRTDVNTAQLKGSALLQLNLHGRHNIIKESAQYTVNIHPDAIHTCATPAIQRTMSERLKSYCQRWF
ncbi:hypothetical protein AAEU32_11180 [Pseudoalteromonas sp. SSDWG2]|uniref:hypothetical protein n=1 Tax=Pseudoalteromonas sp. SSDWG2 TaxID=3139391 RepID=UPI003BA95988